METGAIFIIQNQMGRFLLEQRSAFKREPWCWVFPGGKKEDHDQTTIDTVIREIKEEFGMDIPKEGILKIGRVDREVEQGFLSIYYTQVEQPDKLIISDSAGAGWFRLEEIEKIELGYNQKNRIWPILKNFLENQK